MTEQQKEDLVTSLNQLLADTAVFRHKAQVYHWNITGLLFGELHAEFGDIYDMLADDYDATAEQVRAIGETPYAGLLTFVRESVLEDASVEALTNDPTENQRYAVEMIRNLYDDNEKILRVISEIEKVAEEADAQGVLDFINGRHSTHNMIRYKLGSYLGGPNVPTDSE